ncbi:uncharacterized protein LOC109826696 [Asparagus officinalis]|uniref:uncharacterized protein LOC109826696 n=1 Tax=Asparagus officinalis TaxID=4686 RepID=UPI00098E1280|nr:uncharacterized protein LOC109826696 [Asparagus officinalis]
MARNYIRDKDWMYVGRAERMQSIFVNGVGAFMDFVRRHDMVRHGRLICPCKLCANRLHQLEEEVELHIVKNGFVSDYKTWVYHGQIEGLSDADEEEQEDDNLFLDEEMEEMVEVALGNTSPAEDPPFGGHREDNYDKYMNDAKRPIYENAKHSTLSWFVHLFQIKCLNKWSNKSFTMLLKFLKDSMPPGNHVPDNWYEAQKIMSNLGLKCEMIHACPNDCIIYWKENSDNTECPTCGEARYKKKVHGQKKDIPIKLVRYFPITQRLQRLFKCKKTAVAMTWHHRARPSENGRMSHPRDTPAWKDFDSRHPTFSQEPRNIRLGLASDGFCPFSFKGNPHSTWPVVMMIYNLSPWLAMDQSYFMMPLLIDGPKSPGNNIDVYLRPLIEELKSLFIDGVDTYDADTGTNFTMRVALMWTINDFPAYGMLSGWSVHGYTACPYCHLQTTSKRLPFSKKTCYCGHRRMLDENHPYRDDIIHFDGTKENRPRPDPLSGEDILAQWNGKNNVTFGKIKGRQETPQGWNKKSIFFELPYWKTNKVRHNLDVMHIEKGVSEHILNLLLCKDGKSKDNLKARRDLQAWNIRKELHPIPKAERKPHQSSQQQHVQQVSRPATAAPTGSRQQSAAAGKQSGRQQQQLQAGSVQRSAATTGSSSKRQLAELAAAQLQQQQASSFSRAGSPAAAATTWDHSCNIKK